MFKNYFKTLVRNLIKSKGFTFINIAGLSIGMTAAVLILLWIQNELGMERFHEKKDRTYLMYNRDKDPEGTIWAWNNTPKILAPTLIDDYPEVEDAVRYSNITFLLTAGETKINKRGAFVDSSFLSIFSFPLAEGKNKALLDNVYNIVITKKLATALFGDEAALGKTIRIDSVHNCTVTGVLKDLPSNTTFDFEYLLPWSYMKKLDWSDSNWSNNSVKTYALLKPGSSQQSFDNKIRNITIDHTRNSRSPSTTEVFTQPLERVYLYGKQENGKLIAGQVETVTYFGVIALFILLIACINFMNLSTARSEKRAKEVGIRKAVGAPKKLLVLQFIGESLFISLISFLIALVIIQVSLEPFNLLVNRRLEIQYGNIYFWLFSLSFVLFTGVIAGSYPAFYLSAFNPVKVLKGTFKSNTSDVTPRKVLVVVQFTLTTIFIICTVIISRQINYTLNRDSGYEKENLVYMYSQGEIDKHYQVIRQELLNSGAVASLSRSANPITQRWGDSWGFTWTGATKNDEKLDFIRLGSDAAFAKTMGVTLLEGRDIDVHSNPSDSNAVLLNETAVKQMRIKDPLGMIIREIDDPDAQWRVVGLVKDFILESPFEKTINPMIIFGPKKDYAQVIHMKLNPDRTTEENMAKINGIFKRYNPDYPVEAIFAYESYANKFKKIQETEKLAKLFATLTIFISCLGLFGLTAYLAQNRTKEIGVRKVLGASIFNITALLSVDFLKLVLVGFAIAAPLAWYAMHRWLEGYSYRIEIEWWTFLLAAAVILVISVVTVSFQTIRAAMVNPVKSLRSE